MDEPLAALDAVNRRKTRSVLAQQIKSILTPAGVPVVMVTHDVRDVVLFEAHVDVYIYALEDGKVVQQGTLSELAAAPATDFIAEFVADVETDIRG